MEEAGIPYWIACLSLIALDILVFQCLLRAEDNCVYQTWTYQEKNIEGSYQKKKHQKDS